MSIRCKASSIVYASAASVFGSNSDEEIPMPSSKCLLRPQVRAVYLNSLPTSASPECTLLPYRELIHSVHIMHHASWFTRDLSVISLCQNYDGSGSNLFTKDYKTKREKITLLQRPLHEKEKKYTNFSTLQAEFYFFGGKERELKKAGATQEKYW